MGKMRWRGATSFDLNQTSKIFGAARNDLSE